MQTSQLFTLLPEEWVDTPDGMTIDRSKANRGIAVK